MTSTFNDEIETHPPDSLQPQQSKSGTRLTLAGSVLSAVAASACCWIPLLLLAFGLSTGGVAAWFEEYRVVFLITAGVLLATGFYLVYFRKSSCKPGETCAVPGRRIGRVNQVMLWVATVVVIATAAFPNYVGYLLADTQSAETCNDEAEHSTISLIVDGMTCGGCAVVIQHALQKVPGVKSASVSFEDARATVSVDDQSTPGTDDLISAVQQAGYRASAFADTGSAPESQGGT